MRTPILVLAALLALAMPAVAKDSQSANATAIVGDRVELETLRWRQPTGNSPELIEAEQLLRERAADSPAGRRLRDVTFDLMMIRQGWANAAPDGRLR